MEKLRESIHEAVAADHPMTVRQVFYRLAVSQAVPKTENGYDTVQQQLLLLRRTGVIPHSWIADNTRWMRKPTSFGSAEEALDYTAQCYRRALWQDQDAYVEIWCEKDALAGVIYQETAPYDVPLMVSRGFSSESFLYEAANSIAGIEACRANPRERVPRLMLLDWCKEHDDLVRAEVAKVMALQPDLTFEGYGVDWPRWDRDAEARARRFASSRERLSRTNRGFALALCWLATRAGRSSHNTRQDSYRMKHEAERFADPDGYVSNGTLLCAALFLGLRCKPTDRVYGAIAVSTALAGERERLRAEKEARRVARLRRAEEARRRRCFLPPLPPGEDWQPA